MTATVVCDRCGEKYTLVGDTRVMNDFQELVTVPFYSFSRSTYEGHIRGIRQIWVLYKGKDYCPECWEGYQVYKRKMEAQEDVDYMMEKKKQEEAKEKQEQETQMEKQKQEEEKKKWKNMKDYEYEEYLKKMTPDVNKLDYLPKEDVKMPDSLTAPDPPSPKKPILSRILKRSPI